MGKSHALMGATTGICVGRLCGGDIPTQLLLGAICGVTALAPDIDEPQSLASRHMPYVGGILGAGIVWLVFGRVPTEQPSIAIAVGVFLACVLVCAGAPRLIKSSLGHRGFIHHPWLGLVLLLAGIGASVATTWLWPFAIAVGWNVHLLGDAMTMSGLPRGTGRSGGKSYEERHGLIEEGKATSWQKRWGGGKDRMHVLPKAWRFRTGTGGETVALLIWSAAMLVAGLLLPIGGIPLLWNTWFA